MPRSPLIDEDPAAPPDWPACWRSLLDWHRTTGQGPQPGETPPPTPPAHWSSDSRHFAERYWPLLARASADGGGWVLAQLGQSLDGCIATHDGDSCFVTGPESLHHLHRLRALADAVVVGTGTVVADNPQLTTRRVPGPHARRVVLDPAARLDGRARLLHDGQAPSVWMVDGRHAGTAQARLQAARDEQHGEPTAEAEVWPVDGLEQSDGGPDPARLVAALAARGCHRLLIEGGGATVSRCLAAGVLDRLHLVIAPLLIGTGRPGLRWPGPARLADCRRPPARCWPLGADVLWDLDLRG